MSLGRKILLFILVVAAGVGGAWSYISSGRGRARVAFTPASQECHFVDEWKYCIFRAVQGTSEKLLYHFHGRNQRETIWNDNDYYTGMLQKHWQENGTKPPTVVTISKGPLWLLGPRSAMEFGGLFHEFAEIVVPDVEKKVFPGKPLSRLDRLIVGESMGGINALLVSLLAPEFASKVAALCPPLYKEMPTNDVGTIRAFTERTGADPQTIFAIASLVSRFVPNAETWNQFSPLSMIESLPAEKSPKYYVSTGLYDKYGNFEGVEEFVRIAKARGLPLQWHPLYGGHCATDTVSVAEFLTTD